MIIGFWKTSKWATNNVISIVGKLVKHKKTFSQRKHVKSRDFSKKPKLQSGAPPPFLKMQNMIDKGKILAQMNIIFKIK